VSEWIVQLAIRHSELNAWRARVVVLKAEDSAVVSESRTCAHAHAHQDTAMTCGRRWARDLNAAAAAPELVEFQVTFGSQYSPRNQTHPLWPLAHKDGWVTITAPSAEVARAIAAERLGVYWSMLYSPAGYEGPGLSWGDFDPTFFPLGELAHATWEPGGGHTWDQTRAEQIWATLVVSS
jgi:hypothetical protein